jgi:uncharacterized membrane protein YkvA (DUF1232 family)
VHYSDDDQTPRRPAPGRDAPLRGRSAEDDDDLVGPRRGGASAFQDDDDDEELVGRRRGGQGARRSILDDDEDDGPPPARRPRGSGRSGGGGSGKMGMVRDIPNYVKLLARLARDPRVSKVDKAIVAATLVYMVSPVDLVPDWVVPVVGQIEDVYLLALALSRLVNNAGMEVLLDHWEGDPGSLESALSALDRAGSLLPGPVRAILGGRA